MPILRRMLKLEPKYLDSNVKSYIISVLRDKLCGKCVEDHGYILDILKLNKIVDNKISRSATDIIVIVDIDVETLKPNIGDIFEGIVTMVGEHGIILEVKGCLNIFIYRDFMEGYTLDLTETFFHKKTGEEIREGDTLKIQILGLQFSNGEFDCFGKLL